MKLILHIGVHKTATSSIQENFANLDPQILKTHGYLYPVFSNGINELVNHSAVFFSLFTEKPTRYHMNVRWGFNTLDKVEALNQSYKKQLNNLFNSNADTIIISGEGISSLSLLALQSLKLYLVDKCGIDEIEVICATREHSSFLNSDVQERVKAGQTINGSVLNVSRHIGSFYSNILFKFESVFGRGSIKLYKFESSVKNSNGVFDYFLTNFFPDIKLIGHKELRSNKSLSHEAVELISYINKHQPIDFYEKGKVKRNKNDTLAINELSGKKFQVDIPESILKKIKEDQDWLKNNYSISYQNDHNNNKIKLDYWGADTLAQVDNILLQLNDNIKSLAIEFFRDKAIALESSNLKLAYKMMSIAQKYRPNGPVITKKMFIYADKLKEIKQNKKF